MLWAWETPEDLTALDPHKAGVAFLSREILLNETLHIRPRSQPLHVASGAWIMAVVRIETGPEFRPSEELIASTVKDIAAVASEPNVKSIQVDFDASASEREFYASVLRALRAQIGGSMPLSITALTSWCGEGSWLHGLPVDEAVPMFFRMGGPAVTRASSPRDAGTVTEESCSGSVGIATDEAWPAVQPGQRVYVFRPGSWTQKEIAKINAFGYEGLKQ